MKHKILILLITMGQAAQAVSPGVWAYSNEETEAMRYAAQTKYQARQLDLLAKAARRHCLETQRAKEQAIEQESAYQKLQSLEEQTAKANVHIAEYRHVDYIIDGGNKETKAVIK